MVARILLACLLCALIGVPSTAAGDASAGKSPSLIALAEMGSAALPFLFHGESEVREQLIFSAGDADWSAAVEQLQASLELNAEGYPQDIGDYEVLIALRIAGLYLDEELDETGQGRLIHGIYSAGIIEELAPFYPVLLCADDLETQMHGLILVSNYPTYPPGILTRLRQLTESPEEAVRAAALLLLPQFEAMQITQPLPMPNVGGPWPSGGGGFLYRRSRGGGGRAGDPPEPLLDPDDYTVEDLPVLWKLYRTGDEEMRLAVAHVLRTHLWPEAFDLVDTMLRDESDWVRWSAINIMIAYDTSEARVALCEFYLQEEDASLRRHTLRYVLLDATPEPHRERVFRAALGSDAYGEICLTLRALEYGRMSTTEYTSAALIDRFFASPGPREFVQRALGCLWDVDIATAGRAVEAVSELSDRDYVTYVVEQIPGAGQGRPNEQAVTLLQPFLELPEETIRTAVAQQLTFFLCDAAMEDLTQILETGDSVLADAVVSSLRRVGEDPRIINLLETAITADRPELLERTLRAISLWIDARANDLLTRVAIGTADIDRRVTALYILTRTGTLLTTPAMAPLLASEPQLVARAVYDLDRLLRIPEPDIPTLIREPRLEDFRRVRDREALWSALLGRLAGGDYDVLQWFHVRLPNLGLPDEPESLLPGPLARWIAERLGVAVGPVVPLENDLVTEPVYWEDATGNRWDCAVPRSLYLAIGTVEYYRSDESHSTYARQEPPRRYRGR